MMMQKPKRLLYPQELIDRNVTRLQIQLRKLYREYKRTPNVDKRVAQLIGEHFIYEAFEKAQADVKAYVEKRGLEYAGDDAELKEALTEALENWRGIVSDF